MTISRRALLGSLTAAGIGLAIDPTLATAAPTLTGSNWMSGLADSRSLASLTIPGTHDTCALYGGPLYQCQTAPLAEQLTMGVRFLDIRTKYGDTLPIHHEAAFQRIHLAGVLDQCRQFLRANPGESILMSVKQEHSEKPASDMSRVWQKVTAPYGDLLVTNSSVPDLGSVRGKVVVVTREDGFPGIPWNSVTKADDYKIPSADVWHSRKWPGVVQALETASTDSAANLHVTFLSSSGFSAWPPSILNPADANALMEPKMREWLDARPLKVGERLGVMLVDFAKPWRIQQIGARNFGRKYWS